MIRSHRRPPDRAPRGPGRPLLVTIGAETLPLWAWIERYGIKRRTVEHRRARGQTWRQAITEPVGKAAS